MNLQRLTNLPPGKTLRILGVAVLLTCSPTLRATETIIALPLADEKHVRQPYDLALLLAALTATEAEYGSYQFALPERVMVSKRALIELVRGKNLSVTVSTYKKHWQGKTLIVPFPVKKGLGSFRMFFADQQNRARFGNIHTLEQLKSFRFGQGLGWSTAAILTKHEFHVVYQHSYENLFKMLEAGRFDLLMRGADEILREKHAIQDNFSSLYVESRIVLYTYLPIYFHVTPKRPALAERLQKGLLALHSSGELDTLFGEYFNKELSLLQSLQRPPIFIENVNLPAGTYERDKPYLVNIPHIARKPSAP